MRVLTDFPVQLEFQLPLARSSSPDVEAGDGQNCVNRVGLWWWERVTQLLRPARHRTNCRQSRPSFLRVVCENRINRHHGRRSQRNELTTLP